MDRSSFFIALCAEICLWYDEESKSNCHPSSRKLAKSLPSNSSRDFWNFCRVPVESRQTDRSIFRFQTPPCRSKFGTYCFERVQACARVHCIISAFFFRKQPAAVDLGNSYNPGSYGKLKVGPFLRDEGAGTVGALLSCEIHVRHCRSWNRFLHCQSFLVTSLGSGLALGPGDHRDRWAHSAWTSRRLCKSETSIISTGRKSGGYMAECPFVAP